MALTKKTKGVLVIILFMAILLLPFCYAFLRDRLGGHTEMKQEQTPAAPVNR